MLYIDILKNIDTTQKIFAKLHLCLSEPIGAKLRVICHCTR